MENSALVSLSRQIALQRKLNVVADNVANMNTDGFKRQIFRFEEAGMPNSSMNLFNSGDRANSFVKELPTLTDFSTGAIEKTGGSFDVAIEGDAFFVIQTAEGERYTRAGNFQIDVTGTLVTTDGQPVLGEGGPIVFGPEETGIIFARDGTIASSEGPKGRLRLVSFANVRELLKEGANRYVTDQPPQPVANARIMQGFVERSNVSAVSEMTELIQLTRLYEQVSDIVRKQDDLRAKAIDALGKLS